MHHVVLAHLAEVPAAEHGDEGGLALRVVVLQRLAAPWRREGVLCGYLAEGSEPRGGERVAAPCALVGDVVLHLRHEQHEHLAPAPAPAPERPVRAVHEHALELGCGLLALGLGRLALYVPVDDEAAHVHLLVDAEVERQLGLHVMSSRLVRRGIPFGPPGVGHARRRDTGGLGSPSAVTGSGMWEGPATVCEACPRSRDRVSVAAEVFSMYAYQELKVQLDGLDEFRFIFTSQAFTKSRPPKQEIKLGEEPKPVPNIGFRVCA